MKRYTAAAHLSLRELVDTYNLPISEERIQAAEYDAMRPPRLRLSDEQRLAMRLLEQRLLGE
jgi:hypothetical protein